MPDHLFLSVRDLGRSIAFYTGARLHYDPRYYAANVLDPDGYSLEFVHKSWQHP